MSVTLLNSLWHGSLIIISPLQQAQDDYQTINIAILVITSQPPSQLAMSSRIIPPRYLVADMKLAAGTCPTRMMRLSGGRRGMSGLHLWPPCHLPGYRHQSYTSYQPSILSEGWPWCGPQPGQDFCAVGRSSACPECSQQPEGSVWLFAQCLRSIAGALTAQSLCGREEGHGKTVHLMFVYRLRLYRGRHLPVSIMQALLVI